MEERKKLSWARGRMNIPSNLKSKKVSKFQCIQMVRAMQRAIKEECFECMRAASLRRVKNCPGNRLSNGRTCPLYGFRPGADS